MNKSIVEVEENIQSALEKLPEIMHSLKANPMTAQIGEALKILAPIGYCPVVELQENGRRKRRTASADNWDPETGEILISFSREQVNRTSDAQPAGSGKLDARAGGSRHAQGISALQRAGRNEVEFSDETRTPHREQFRPRAERLRLNEDAALSGPERLKPIEDGVASRPATAEQELCRALEEVERQGLAFVALKWFRDDVLPSKYRWAADSQQRQAVLVSAIEKGLVLTSKIPNPRSPFPTTSIKLNRSRMVSPGVGRRYSPVTIHGEPLSETILRDRGTR